ncbi:MAG: hypothetical protein NZ960_02190 [Candidatus Kapabacteria bacterium]|nr:hypothetical protein [Candidatus Kapabacteria bacterium]MDW8011833.1 hypothetical protein [Bacteroidota bacterium]
MQPLPETLLLQLRWELETSSKALQEGNEGKARVCARRAVAWLVQALPQLGYPSYGTHVGQNLRELASDSRLPEHVRQAAARLQGGARAQLQGQLYSLHPLRDAAIILHYFAQQLGAEETIVPMLRELQLCDPPCDCSP